MNNDRAWMYQRKDSRGYLNPVFLKGLENFMQYVISRPSSLNGTNIQCPCLKCQNHGGFWNAETVKLHLMKNGFVSDYYVWNRHGEPYIVGQSGGQSQSRQGTPNVSSSAANNYIYWNIGSTDNNGRTRAEVIKKVLEPSHECSSKIRQIMYEKLEPTGYNWKSISKETRDFYFEEFKKYFVWRQSDAVIYQGWLANARRKYSELCSVAHSSWEKREQPDKRINMDVYSSWTVFWETPKFQKKSEIQKNNRSSGVDGNLSTHTSGSASHRTIAARAQMKYQCDPTTDQIFLITHLKNPNIKKIMCGENDEDEENGENCNDERIWVDKKSQLTYEKFERLCEEQVKAGRPVDKNALFLEAAGGFDKKKRVYGVGSSQDLFYRQENVPSSPSFANVENHKLLEELKVMKDKVNTIENQIAKLLEINSFRAQSPATEVDDVDSQSGEDGDE